MNNLTGRTLGRYRIIEQIGAGGMGEVYRARDTSLGRDVAVKVLPAEHAGELSRIERFEREGRAVARLSHPNILAIHDFGRDEGVVYAVTELLEGRDLRRRMNRSPLPPRKTLKIAAAVADGLGSAHANGIVHRDIKPENIFVTTSGQVKILDFGVARLREPVSLDATTDQETAETLTGAGSRVGTAGYMSPEQILGQIADARSDIFALGCVLYEMLARRRAFERDTAAETMRAILDEDPIPLNEVRPELPPRVVHIVNRCLEKQPEERYQSARDLAFAIESTATGSSDVAWRPAPSRPTLRLATIGLGALGVVALATGLWSALSRDSPLPQPKHVAVLPFRSADTGEVNTALAAGMTDIVAAGLSVLEESSGGEFWVVPQERIRRRGLETSRKARDEFDVTIGVQGSIQVADDHYSIDLDLIDAERNRSVRSVTVDTASSNLRALQVQPVLAVAAMLEIDVQPESLDRITGGGTNIITAFDAYIRGLGVLRLANRNDELFEARSILASAVAADPRFTAARVALGHAHLESFAMTRDRRLLESGFAEAHQAVALGDREVDARVLLAEAHAADAQPDLQVAVLEEAVALAPDNATVRYKMSAAYEAAEDLDAAIDAARHVAYLRPGFFPPHIHLGVLYYVQGEYEISVTEFRQAIQCAPRQIDAHNNLGAALFEIGRLDEAREAFEASLAVKPNYVALSNLGTVYFELSRYADATAAYQQALDYESNDHVIWGNLAALSRLGSDDEATRKQLGRAIDLAEEALQSRPRDPQLMSTLASYYVEIDDAGSASRILDELIATDVTDPTVMFSVGVIYEELDDRQRALDWIERAMLGGVRRSIVENTPALRSLLTDGRYREMVKRIDGLGS